MCVAPQSAQDGPFRGKRGTAAGVAMLTGAVNIAILAVFQPRVGGYVASRAELKGIR